MKLQEYRQEFYTYSGKLSDIGRQFAFAGIAVIWLFKKDIAGSPTLPRDLILPLMSLILTLSLDFTQYLLGTLIWRSFYISKERANVKETADIKHSVWYERPIYFAFIAKLLSLVAAYIFLTQYLWRLWSA